VILYYKVIGAAHLINKAINNNFVNFEKG
jgi:hypothetical protein